MGGFLPLGYRANGGGRAAMVRLEPKGAALVLHIFERYSAGDSLLTIARDLQEQEVPTARGAAWSKGTVAAILGNRAYLGGEFPMIVDERLFERCAARRQGASKHGR